MSAIRSEVISDGFRKQTSLEKDEADTLLNGLGSFIYSKKKKSPTMSIITGIETAKMVRDNFSPLPHEISLIQELNNSVSIGDNVESLESMNQNIVSYKSVFFSKNTLENLVPLLPENPAPSYGSKCPLSENSLSKKPKCEPSPESSPLKKSIFSNSAKRNSTSEYREDEELCRNIVNSK